MKRVLVTDYTWDSTAVEAGVLAGVGATLIEAETGSEAELVELAGEADAILTCFAKVPGNVVRAGKSLQVIGRYGVGVDNIDVAEATRLGVLVTNVPDYCIDEVSDHTLALALALARKVCVYNAGVREGNWELAAGAPMFRLRGKTMGILGLGRIGQATARKAEAFGMFLIAHDPYASTATAASLGVELVELDVLFSRSDFLCIHAPLAGATRGMVNEARLRQMRPTAFLINAARGPIVDQSALVRALQEGWIAGAGLDVFEQERLPDGHPLLELSNVVATPHVAFYSEESLIDLRTLAAKNVAEVLAGRKPASLVNREVLALPRWAHLFSTRD